MATAVKRNVGLRDYGTSVVIPNDDVARLMYYLRSVTVSCDLDILQDDLVDFQNYHRLSERRADQVFEVAYQYSPDEFHQYVLHVARNAEANARTRPFRCPFLFLTKISLRDSPCCSVILSLPLFAFCRKTIFLDETGQLTGTSLNKFLEITEATDFVHLQSEVLIAGKTTKVKKIMAFEQAWLDQYYLQPMQRNVDRLKRSMIASRTNHCQHCAGNAGKCACKTCPKSSQSKCSRTLSLHSLVGALAVKIDDEAGKAREAKLRHCDHCKGLAAPCGCESGCSRPGASTCEIVHKGVMCDSCRTTGLTGARFKCADCADFDLCVGCYSKNAHGEHSFLQIDRVGCKAVKRLPRTPKRAAPAPAKAAPRAAPAAPSSTPAVRQGFFYLSMSPSELKAYLHENGVSYDDCFEKGDLQRRAWECHADCLSGPELVTFMRENNIAAPPSACRNIAGRRECLKKAFQVPSRPAEPTAVTKPAVGTSFKSGQRVTLTGLKTARMNGKSGTVQEPVTSVADRAMVAIDGIADPMLIKYVNLTVACTLLD